jgi:FtsP/CotA-like multicopper oxidase with cupredoxin domain
MFVNWTLEPFLDVERRHYRLRILNACNARVLRLAFVTARKANLPFSVIGGDGGMLERSCEVREMFIAPAQRVDLVIDFGLASPGEPVMMTSLKYDPMENDGRPGDPAAEHPGAPMMGEAFDVMRFRVGRGPRKTATMPPRFEPLAPLKTAGAPQRSFRLHIDGMKWLLNGRNYYDDMHRVDFTTRAGSTEVWEMRNETKSMPHPMHVHGFHFRVLSRAGSPAQVRRLAVDAAGRSPLDLGWQDTVLVWPGETVRIAVDFSTARPGTNHYMFHCHNLEHEDSGLMLNFAVSA